MEIVTYYLDETVMRFISVDDDSDQDDVTGERSGNQDDTTRRRSGKQKKTKAPAQPVNRGTGDGNSNF